MRLVKAFRHEVSLSVSVGAQLGIVLILGVDLGCAGGVAGGVIEIKLAAAQWCGGHSLLTALSL